jgi:hypothetical protein
MAIYRPVLLGMRNVSDITCGENQNTHFMSNNFFSPQTMLFIEIMWEI